MLSQGFLQTPEAIEEAVARYGVAVGGLKLLSQELEAALIAEETGEYIVWRCSRPLNPACADFCTRIGPSHVCFCKHPLSSHDMGTPLVSCTSSLDETNPDAPPCPCSEFRYLPSRPEEVGDGHLVKRRNFSIRKWSPKCRCGHGASGHQRGVGPKSRCRARGCSCRAFDAAFACGSCDGRYGDHLVVIESESERVASGLPIRSEFYPLAELPELQDLVFQYIEAAESGGPSPVPSGEALVLSRAITHGNNHRGGVEVNYSMALPPVNPSMMTRRRGSTSAAVGMASASASASASTPASAIAWGDGGEEGE